MFFREIWKRRISLLLVMTLLASPVMQVSAEEIPEETEQLLEAEVFEETEAPEEAEVQEETEATEETEVQEETEATEETEAPEETEVLEETEIPEETEALEEPEVLEEAEATEAPEVPEETEATEETEAPEETLEQTVTEESEQQEISQEPVQASLAPAVPIAEVLAMGPGEESLVIAGTVVFAQGLQAVLQDDTVGIRLSFSSPPEIVPGDMLLVKGHRSGGFAVEEFEKMGTGDLPVRELALENAEEALRILVKAVVLGQNSLSRNGYACQLAGTIPEGLKPGDRADVWGVLLDGVFYADAMAPSDSPEPEETPDNDWNYYFGQLHAHTGISDGTGTVEEAFAHARIVNNLDFFAVTDHSNSFDNADQGVIDEDGTAVSQEWAAGKAAAEAVTDETFVGIFGYEMTWPEYLAIGHMNTFSTPGWLTRDQEGMGTLEGYLDALEAVPDSVSQFNHPGGFYGDFGRFSDYSPQYDARVHLLEVGGEGSFTAYDAFTTALDAGWHLAPSNNQNNHNGNWGSAETSRTVVLARELTEEAIFDAVRNYRVYATEDADLKIAYRLNGRIMGSIIPEAETLRAEACLTDGSGDSLGRIEIVTDGGQVATAVTAAESGGEYSLEVPTGGSYYYLRILRNEEIVAVTAPVWVDNYEDLGISAFFADQTRPLQGTSAALTLTLYNHENIPFVLENVTFTKGEQILESVEAPGSVAPMEEREIALSYSQEEAGAVTVTATVTGTIAGLERSFRKDITLYFQALEAQQQSVGEVRKGRLGETYRIRGYVTAGTANPYNTFPGSIYLQDDSGGIEVRDFSLEGVQVGTPMEIEGILRSVGGNLVLAMTDYEILQEDFYRFAPRTMTHETAMNYETHGGEVLQIEGSVVSVTKTPDQKGVSRFTIRDIVGDLATVIVEDGVGSGAYGTNELVSEVRMGKVVRAIGLLHMDEYGKPVLRVRNCDEVAYVPPVKDPSNPKTGDLFAWLKLW